MSSLPPGAAEPVREVQETVGAELARARQAAGLSLDEAARQLKFAARQLDALEHGELGRLPGSAAVRGMVRSYARLLQLDPEPLVARVAAGGVIQGLAQRFRQPVPFSDGARRSNLAYVALSLTLLVVVVAVALEWRQERAGTPRLAFVSAAQQPAEAQRAAASEDPRVTVASAAPAPRVQAPRVQAPQVQAPQAQVTQARAAAPALSGAADEAAPAGTARLALQFEGESWVEIRSGSGKLLVASLNAAGTERLVSGLPPFDVVIGNAQQVRLIYNDKPVDLAPYVKVEVARFTLR
jgi:cytoskeleton protein RodZ